MQTNLHISKLPADPVVHIDYGAQQGVKTYKGNIAYVAPNAAVGMVVDATKTVHPFREIFNYTKETNRTLRLNMGNATYRFKTLYIATATALFLNLPPAG